MSIWKESHLKKRKGKQTKSGTTFWRGDNEKTEVFSFLFTEALKQSYNGLSCSGNQQHVQLLEAKSLLRKEKGELKYRIPRTYAN